MIRSLWALVLFFSASAQAFTFEDLAAIIKSGNVKSIEQLLPLLPEELRADYVLMYRSRSLQDASFENPRAIMFGKDARLVLSFNGDPSHKGFSEIEAIQYREKEARFEFREIQFGARVDISAANPAKCLKCHQAATRTGVDPRPNWEPYSFWPGAYGAADGFFKPSLSRQQIEKNLSKDPEMLAIVRAGDGERAGLERYQANAPNHPRYKYLGPM
ncbi:MAG: hypothetical protein ABL958_20625, partial [Bdellovibrionia bacterium]